MRNLLVPLNAPIYRLRYPSERIFAGVDCPLSYAVCLWVICRGLPMIDERIHQYCSELTLPLASLIRAYLGAGAIPARELLSECEGGLLRVLVW